MIDHLQTVEVGTRVSYEDAANPRRVGAVTEIDESRWGTNYHVEWDEQHRFDGVAGTYADLRQHGWHLVNDDPGSLFDGADVIHVVRRIDLIESGDLVPATDLVPDEPTLVSDAGFVAPTCLTRALADIVVPNDKEVAACQDVKGRLWDLLSMARMYRRGQTEWGFPCIFVLKGRGTRGPSSKTHHLRAVLGPDDLGEPCVTLMLRGED